MPGWKKLLIGACDDGKPRRSTSSGACQLLEALIARPNAVSRQTRDKDTGCGSRLQRRRTHTSLPIIFCSHKLRRKYMDHRFTGDLMKRFRNRLACLLLDAKRSLVGHHRQSLSINFLSDQRAVIRGVLETTMQMMVGWWFENWRWENFSLSGQFSSVWKKKWRIKAYALQFSRKLRLNCVLRTTSSKFSNSIFSKTLFFFRWKKFILYIYIFFSYFHV